MQRHEVWIPAAVLKHGEREPPAGGRLDHRVTVTRVERERFLAHDVLARVQRIEHDAGVGRRRGCHDHQMHIAEGCCQPEPSFVSIAHRGQPQSGRLVQCRRVRRAQRAEADEADPDGRRVRCVDHAAADGAQQRAPEGIVRIGAWIMAEAHVREAATADAPPIREHLLRVAPCGAQQRHRRRRRLGQEVHLVVHPKSPMRVVGRVHVELRVHGPAVRCPAGESGDPRA